MKHLPEDYAKTFAREKNHAGVASANVTMAANGLPFLVVEKMTVSQAVSSRRMSAKNQV